MGMRCLKVGFIPVKADPKVQEEYKKDKLEPRLSEAKEGKRAVFFVDAAHARDGGFSGSSVVRRRESSSSLLRDGKGLMS